MSPSRQLKYYCLMHKVKIIHFSLVLCGGSFWHFLVHVISYKQSAEISKGGKSFPFFSCLIN